MFAALLFNQPLTLKLVYHAQASSRNRTILHAPFLSPRSGSVLVGRFDAKYHEPG